MTKKRRRSWLSDSLEANYLAVRDLRNQILTADRFSDAKYKNAAVRALLAVLDDTIGLLSESWWSNPPMPEELMDDLRVTFLIQGTVIEILLRDRPDLSEKIQKAMLLRARKIAKTLRVKARGVHSIIKREWPDYLTDKVLTELERMSRGR